MNEVFFTVALALLPEGALTDDRGPRIVEHFPSMADCQRAQPYLERLHREQNEHWVVTRARQVIREQDVDEYSDEADAVREQFIAGLRVECHATTYAMPSVEQKD